MEAQKSETCTVVKACSFGLYCTVRKVTTPLDVKVENGLSRKL